MDSIAELQLTLQGDILKVNDNRLTFNDFLLGNNHDFVYSISPQDTVAVDPISGKTVDDLIFVDLNFKEDELSSFYEWHVNGDSLTTIPVSILELECDLSLANESIQVNVTNTVVNALYNDSLTLATTPFTIENIEDLCLNKMLVNTFTPDGNGRNDVFILYGLTTNSELIIFNRWGDIVFQKKCNTPPECGWDGKFNGEDLPWGTYYYILKRPGQKVIEGDVTILR